MNAAANHGRCSLMPASPLMNHLLRLLLFVVLAALGFRLLSSWLTSSAVHVPISAFPRPELRVSNGSRFEHTFPKLIHVMWKNDNSPPPETTRWQSGCQALNEDMEVRRYNDDELLRFVTKEYPEYLPLFSKLRGVHMADMARVLVTYHFGGLYMDLDFYCVRPFRCLSQFLPNEIGPNDHILLVPLETRMHSTVFRDKERVVIQDFFLATPKHPFFKFLLDDRMAAYNEDPEHHAKGPFGYHIEEDVDKFWNSISKSSSEGGRKVFIVELRDDVLHALADGTHSKLRVVCYSGKVTAVSEASCSHFRRGELFQPSRNTVAVHMWFHTYLGWHLFRGLRNQATYSLVERSLPQTPQC